MKQTLLSFVKATTWQKKTNFAKEKIGFVCDKNGKRKLNLKTTLKVHYKMIWWSEESYLLVQIIDSKKRQSNKGLWKVTKK